MTPARNRAVSFLALIALSAFVVSSAANAAFIDILANHATSDPAPDTVINSTDDAGTTDVIESSRRAAHNLLDMEGVSGSPLSQSAQWTEVPPSGSPPYPYYNSNAVSTRGDLGMLIDLGGLFVIDAMHLFGYNIVDGGGVYTDRTPGSFEIWTATDASAVTTASSALLVNDISKFTQQGGTQGMSDPGNSATNGETFLFGGAAQPSDLTGTTHVVTASSVTAQYVFLRGLEPIETAATDFNIVGLGEVRFYGTLVPEPSTFLLLALGVTGLGFYGSRRRSAS
jgi:hypothetical protein